MSIILVGSDEGSYTLSGRDITLVDLTFVPIQEQLAYVYNFTQNRLYYAPAEDIARATVAGSVISIDTFYPVFDVNDEVHIQIWRPGYKVESDRSMPVSIQDQHSEVVDLYMHLNKVTLTLNADQAIGDTAIVVTDATGVIVGDILCFKEAGRYTQVTILAIVTVTLTIDSPLDFAYTTAASVHSAEHDLKTTVGSLASPIIYHIQPPAGVKWDVVRALWHIEDDVAMDTAKFGGISALTNGCVLRVMNGVYKNVFNIKSNGEFSERTYDVDYASKAPAGSFGLSVRRTFGGQSKNGVVIRLDGDSNEQLQMMIQDDLTGLDHFHCIVQGHVVVD